MGIFKKNIGWILVLILTVLTILPLFHTGFFSMHDDEQVARLFDLHQTLLSGDFPPRIAPNLGFGYGYPFFNFYPSFAYYVGEAFHLLGFGYIVSTKLMLITGFLLSALFMYIFAREFFGRAGGVVAAVAYTYLPYHAVDIYVRGAFAEFYAFVFLPLIFWSFYKLARSGNSLFIIPSALSIGFLILSHNLIALSSFPFIGLWLLYLFFISKDRLRFCMLGFTAFLLGFGFTAYFWLPSYVERNFTLVNILTSELANYSIHFVCSYQLWNSPWGYGGSIGSCQDGLSFEVGKIQLLLSLAAAILAVCFLFLKHKKRDSVRLVQILVFVCMLVISLFLTVHASKPIWDVVPLLWYIQFPWRFLLIAGFAASFLSGAVLYFVRGGRIRILVMVGASALLIISTSNNFAPEKYLNVSDGYYTNVGKIRWDTSSLAYEYVPRGIATIKSQYDTTRVAITKDEIAKKSYKVISGTLMVAEEVNRSRSKVFSVNSATGGVLQLNTYAFPGWTVYIDEKKTQFQDNNKLKLIRVSVVPGKHKVSAQFEDTNIRTIGNYASLASIIGICIVGLAGMSGLWKKIKN